MAQPPSSPTSHLQSSDDLALPPSSVLETDPFIVVRALYPYTSQDPAAAAAALSFEKDDLIQVVAQLESGWWYGFCGGHRGWFPSNFVEEITQADIDLDDDGDINSEQSDNDTTEDIHSDPRPDRHHHQYGIDTDPDSTSSDNDLDTIREDLWLPQTTADGQLYYFNTRTGDSSWSIPTPGSTTVSAPVPQEKTSPLLAKSIIGSDLSGHVRSPSNSQILKSANSSRNNISEQDRVDNLRVKTVLTDPAETDSRGGSTRPNSWQASALPTRAGSPLCQEGPTLGSSNSVRKPSNGSSSLNSSDPLQGMPPMPALSNPFESTPTWVSLAEYTSGAIHNLIQSAEHGYKPYYQSQAAQVVQSIRVMFYASGTIDKDSAPIQLHRHLKGHHRQIMAALSRLVLSAKMASSVWPAEGSVTKMRTDADDVALSVHQFITTAQSAGVTVHDVDGKLIQDPEGPSEARSVRKLSRTFSNSSRGSSTFDGSVNSSSKPSRRSLGSSGLQTQLDYYSKSASKAVMLLSLQIEKVLETAQNSNSSTSSKRSSDSQRAWSLMNSSQSSQLVAQCHQAISQIGSLLTLVGEYYSLVLSTHPSIKDNLFLDVRVSRQALYNHMARLMMSIQLSTDPRAQFVTLESALDASQETERSVADLATAARSLANENDEADQRTRMRTISESGSTLVGQLSTISGSDRLTVSKNGEISDMDQDSSKGGTSRRSDSRPSSMISDISYAGTGSTGSASVNVLDRFQLSQFEVNRSPTQGQPPAEMIVAERHKDSTDGLASVMEITPPSVDFKSKVPLSNKAIIRGAKLKKMFGSEVPAPKAPKVVEAPWYLGYDYSPADITLSKDGSVRGGTLPALVERLTIHDSLDSNFVMTFLLTYRSFASTKEFFEILFRRFIVEPPSGLDATEMANWTENKLTPIRLRVFNIIKSWLESYFLEDEAEDQQVLQKIKHFSESSLMRETMSFPAVQLIKLVEKRENSDVSFRKMVLNLSTQAPQPITPRNLKRIRFMDLDALEFARQLTIMEANNYNKIKPIECLAKAWTSEDPELAAKAVNIRKMITTTNVYSNWINELVLSELDVKKRALILRQIITVAEKLLQLNNFSLLSATTAALAQSPVHRLKRSWELVPTRFTNSLDKLRQITSSARNWWVYRAALHNANPPCVPFVGVYLTHLVGIQDGNSDFIKSTEQHINFAKRISTAEVIREIQQYQAVPYCLTVVAEIQTFIQKGLDGSKEVAELYDMSLAVEPREGDEDKITRLLSESGFL